MPRISKPVEPFDGIRKAIKGNELTISQLAVIWTCSTSTARRKLNDPESITLGEYRALYRKGHIPTEELKEGIRW